MEVTSIPLWLFLLMNQLLVCPAAADQDPLTTTQPYSNPAEDWNSSSTPAPISTTTHSVCSPHTGTNGTRGDCFLNTEMALVAVGSAGGLIICLLVAIVVLAYLVCRTQRQVYVPGKCRSNVDLVSSEGYWCTDRPEVRGRVGPCDASVMLEELKADDEAGAGRDEGVLAFVFDPEEKICHTSSPTSKDCCLEVPKDLEDQPLVV